jgi:hypothetical protein
MKVAFEIRGPVDEPYLKVHREHVLAMTLRPGSMEMGLQRSAMRRITFDAGLMGLCPPRFEQWIGSSDMAHVTMSISDAALMAASDGTGGKVELRPECELVDPRLRVLAMAVDIEKDSRLSKRPSFSGLCRAGSCHRSRSWMCGAGVFCTDVSRWTRSCTLEKG